jgi:hypothetical protein
MRIGAARLHRESDPATIQTVPPQGVIIPEPRGAPSARAASEPLKSSVLTAKQQAGQSSRVPAQEEASHDPSACSAWRAAFSHHPAVLGHEVWRERVRPERAGSTASAISRAGRDAASLLSVRFPA